MKKYSFSSILSWLRPDYHNSSSSKLPLTNGVSSTAIAFTETEKRLIAKLRVEVSLHISFLRKIHMTGVSLTKPSDESIRRYVHLWLPLVVELQQQQALSSSSDNVDPDHPTEYCDNKLLNCLIPPDDIAWLWHCHRLAPYLYLAYIQERFFGKTIEWVYEGMKKKTFISEIPSHEFVNAPNPFSFQSISTSKDSNSSNGMAEDVTIRIWNDRYPHESFFLQPNGVEKNVSTNNHLEDCIISPSPSPIVNQHLLGGFDIVASCLHQGTFLYQISQPNFSNETFIHKGVENYIKFIRLLPMKQHRYIVPTYQIDLIWHTHILSSGYQYHADNIYINGYILDHNDTLNVRTVGGELDTNFRDTVKLWWDVYNERYYIKGGMYRGEAPLDFFHPEWARLKSM
jgi:hypothetical protein